MLDIEIIKQLETHMSKLEHNVTLVVNNNTHSKKK